MSVLNEKRVDAFFMHCLLKDSDHPSEQMIAGGLGVLVKFHAGRIGQNLQYIREMLAELPDEFKIRRVQFEKARVDRAGNRWVSGFWEMTIERLVQLGVASGMVECEQARQRWSRYPPFKVKV